MTTRETTADGVLQELCVTEAARAAFNGWKADARYASDVVPFVLGHRSRVIYETAFEQVRNVGRVSSHALGNVDRKRAEAVKSIRDWNPAFAFTHVLHYCMERLKRVPTWQEFGKFLSEDDLARVMLWKPGATVVQEAVNDGWSEAQASEARRWRVGNAYYSFLREMYTVSYLRHKGLDVQVHPLADALFRVDAWCGDVVMALYIRNGLYRDSDRGRKVHVERMLSGPGSSLRFEPIRLEPADKFGVVKVPAIADLDKVVELLRNRAAV